MTKFARVRTGCWTCKRRYEEENSLVFFLQFCQLTNSRHRKCDEQKPHCNNCLSTNRTCEGYERRILFNRTSEIRKSKTGKRAPFKLNHTNILPTTGVPLPESAKLPLVASLMNVSSEVGLEANGSAGPPLEAAKTDNRAPQPSQAEDSNLDIHLTAEAQNNLEQFSSKLFSNLEAFLLSPHPKVEESRSPLSQVFNSFLYTEITPSDSVSSQESLYRNLNNEIIDFIDRANIFDDRAGAPVSTNSLDVSYQQENMMLKHFFKKLLPLLDAHPLSPWPDLALKYCDFDVARSCFISLACIHIYESRKGGNEFYKTGMAHINSTMNHLIQYISRTLDIDGASSEAQTKKQIQSFVILVLINVHILFAVLEKGKSSLARYLFKVFGSVCQDSQFYQQLTENQSKRSLVVVLSWYDTVCAIVSPDCRLPYCNPEWYGTYTDNILTLEMMGCPGEIFKAMSQVCFLRHEIRQNYMTDDAVFKVEFEGIKLRLLRYRDYVEFSNGENFGIRLKAAQCWSLAVYVSLLRLFKTSERQNTITALVHEFIDVYGSMPSESPLVTQMVWPVYAIGCECISEFERGKLRKYMDTLYETAQMGTLYSLRWLVTQVWEQGRPQEEILTQWLETGVDYLPL